MKRAASRCNFSQLIRDSRQGSPNDRRFMAIGVMTAKFVMKSRRKKFDVDDVKIKRGTSGSGFGYLSPSVVHAWVKDFLASWEYGHSHGISTGAEQLMTACPELPARVRKYWSGI